MSVAEPQRDPGAIPGAVAIIPARYASTRFPGKALATIAGKPMIARVVERVTLARTVREVCVATDDERVAMAAASAGARVIETAPGHATGTDRVAEAACHVEAEIVINVQGDQPLVDPASLDSLVASLDGCEAAAATLVTRLDDDRDWTSPDVVKVVVARSGDAIYFSRAPVPCLQRKPGKRPPVAFKHVGVYAFRRETLLRFAGWPPAELETTEGLEQLRLMAHGVRIRTVEASAEMPSVDRPEDVARIERLLFEEERASAATAGGGS